MVEKIRQLTSVCRTLRPRKSESRNQRLAEGSGGGFFESCAEGIRVERLPAYQCALMMKAIAAIHVDVRHREHVFRNTTHGEPEMKRTVVTALTIESLRRTMHRNGYLRKATLPKTPRGKPPTPEAP